MGAQDFVSFKNNWWKILVVIVVVILIFGGAFVYLKNLKSEKGDFSVNVFLIKSVIKQGGSITNNFRITNNLDKDSDFEISIKGINGFASLSESSFTLRAKESKDIVISFEDNSAYNGAGVYFGEMEIKSNKYIQKVPVTLEINSQDVFFATNLDVDPKYNSINPGGIFSASVRFFNLRNNQAYNIDTTYLVKDANGDSVVFEQENLVVKDDTSIDRTITMPKDAAVGNYVFAVISKHGNSTGTSSYLFSVTNEEKKQTFAFDGSNLGFNLLAGAIFLFLFGIVVLVIYMFKERNELLVELRNQHKEEIDSCIKCVEKQKVAILKKVKKRSDKKKVIHHYARIKKIAIKKIKEKHKKQNKEFKKLKKQNKNDEMKKKLEQWKKQGFNINEVEKPASTKEKINQWKKDGFDTSVFQNKKI